MSDKEINYDIFECKLYITDLETNKQSKEINVLDLIFEDWIEFEFGEYGEEYHAQLPYKDFKFFINDYSVTIYSPQYSKVLDKLERIEKYLDKQHDIPIELLVNIKNIIHSEVSDD